MRIKCEVLKVLSYSKENGLEVKKLRLINGLKCENTKDYYAKIGLNPLKKNNN